MKPAMPERRIDDERVQLACAIWLHTGFIGASAFAGGLVELFVGDTTWSSALALSLLGGVLAFASWRRSRTVLERSGRRLADVDSARVNPMPRRNPRSFADRLASSRRVGENHGHSTAE
jgi:hypothetical protein